MKHLRRTLREGKAATRVRVRGRHDVDVRGSHSVATALSTSWICCPSILEHITGLFCQRIKKVGPSAAGGNGRDRSGELFGRGS